MEDEPPESLRFPGNLGIGIHFVSVQYVESHRYHVEYLSRTSHSDSYTFGNDIAQNFLMVLKIDIQKHCHWHFHIPFTVPSHPDH